MVLSLRLGFDSSALEDSSIAYQLAKGTILPNDKEKFAKMRDKATLCYSSLVRKSYEVFFLLSLFKSSFFHVVWPL